MIQVRCTQCRHVMNYQPAGNSLEGKSKRCVYCGKNFSVQKNVVKITR